MRVHTISDLLLYRSFKTLDKRPKLSFALNYPLVAVDFSFLSRVSMYIYVDGNVLYLYKHIHTLCVCVCVYTEYSRTDTLILF